MQYREALRDVEGISFWDDMEGVKHNYFHFPIFVDSNKYGMTRDRLYEKMRERNILGRRYFYPLISEFSTYKRLKSASRENLPNAYKLASEVICLPLHHGLTEEEVERVILCIKAH